MIIDYKNRTIIIADGISGDGQKTVTINYDRFDKVTYTKTQEGNFVYMDGSDYTPSTLPEGNSLVPGKYTATYDLPNVSFYYPLNADVATGDTFANQMYISPLNPLPVATDGMTVPTEFFNKLIFTNDAGLSVVSIQGNSGSGVGAGEYSITFSDDIPVGTIVTISGILYNQAFEATEIEPYTIQKQIYKIMGFGNNYENTSDFCIHIPMEENTTFYINYVTSEVTLNGLVPSLTADGWYSINDVNDVYGFGSGWMCINLFYNDETSTTSIVGTSALICL